MAKTNIRRVLREILKPLISHVKLEKFAERLNPKIRCRVNCYTKFIRMIGLDVFYYLNELIRQWIKNTYELHGKGKRYTKYQKIRASIPTCSIIEDWE